MNKDGEGRGLRAGPHSKKWGMRKKLFYFSWPWLYLKTAYSRARVGFHLLATSVPKGQTELGKGRPNVGIGFASPSPLT